MLVAAQAAASGNSNNYAAAALDDGGYMHARFTQAQNHTGTMAIRFLPCGILKGGGSNFRLPNPKAPPVAPCYLRYPSSLDPLTEGPHT